jgi:hypothetical protein
MEFCPQCKNVLDIGKHEEISYTLIDSIPEILKLKDISLGDFARLNTTIPKEELQKNNKFLKLSDAEKEHLLNIYKDETVSNVVLRCDNCKYTKLITSTILIYSKSLNTFNVEEHSSIEENKFITHDPLLPHISNYTCPNKECITHKDSTLKDAVSYKKPNSYIRHYICCKCYYNFLLD